MSSMYSRLSASATSQPSSFQIHSSWSKAGVGTSIVLQQQLPRNQKLSGSSFSKKSSKGLLRIVLDLGCTPIFDQTISSKIVVLSHGHVDHFGAVFGHARAHNVIYGGGSIPTYYVPAALASKLEKARECLADLDGTCNLNGIDTNTADASHSETSKRKSLLQMNIVPIAAGQEVELNHLKVLNGMRFYLRAFDVSHGGHPSLGYVIISRTTSKSLKQEYKCMDGKVLGSLVKSGVSIKEEKIVEMIEVSYTGDTSIDGLLLNCEKEEGSSAYVLDSEECPKVVRHQSSREYLQQVFKASLILCEATFLDPLHKELARERGHLNIMDIVPILENHGFKCGIPEEIVVEENKKNADEAFIRKTLSVISDNSIQGDNNKRIVFLHLSHRYAPAEKALDSFCAALPPEVVNMSEVSISSFLSLTDLVLECKKETKPAFLKYVKANGCISLKDFLRSRKE